MLTASHLLDQSVGGRTLHVSAPIRYSSALPCWVSPVLFLKCGSSPDGETKLRKAHRILRDAFLCFHFIRVLSRRRKEDDRGPSQRVDLFFRATASRSGANAFTARANLSLISVPASSPSCWAPPAYHFGTYTLFFPFNGPLPGRRFRVHGACSPLLQLVSCFLPPAKLLLRTSYSSPETASVRCILCTKNLTPPQCQRENFSPTVDLLRSIQPSRPSPTCISCSSIVPPADAVSGTLL